MGEGIHKSWQTLIIHAALDDWQARWAEGFVWSLGTFLAISSTCFLTNDNAQQPMTSRVKKKTNQQFGGGALRVRALHEQDGDGA